MGFSSNRDELAIQMRSTLRRAGHPRCTCLGMSNDLPPGLAVSAVEEREIGREQSRSERRPRNRNKKAKGQDGGGEIQEEPQQPQSGSTAAAGALDPQSSEAEGTGGANGVLPEAQRLIDQLRGGAPSDTFKVDNPEAKRKKEKKPRARKEPAQPSQTAQGEVPPQDTPLPAAESGGGEPKPKKERKPRTRVRDRRSRQADSEQSPLSEGLSAPEHTTNGMEGLQAGCLGSGGEGNAAHPVAASAELDPIREQPGEQEGGLQHASRQHSGQNGAIAEVEGPKPRAGARSRNRRSRGSGAPSSAVVPLSATQATDSWGGAAAEPAAGTSHVFEDAPPGIGGIGESTGAAYLPKSSVDPVRRMFSQDPNLQGQQAGDPLDQPPSQLTGRQRGARRSRTGRRNGERDASLPLTAENLGLAAPRGVSLMEGPEDGEIGWDGPPGTGIQQTPRPEGRERRRDRRGERGQSGRERGDKSVNTLGAQAGSENGPQEETDMGDWGKEASAQADAPESSRRGRANRERRPRQGKRGELTESYAVDHRTGFSEHWKGETLSQGLKSGRALRCFFRVNPNDRSQGFASMDGLPVDIQIQTKEDQNRAISGDVIAVEVLPEAAWLTQRVSLMNAMKKAVSGSADNPKMEVLEELMQKLSVAPPPEQTSDLALRRAGTQQEVKGILAARLRERPDLRATGRVVAILEPTPRRQRLVGVLQREARHVTLIPVDLKMPKCHVRVNELPDTIKKLLEGDPEQLSSTLVSGLMTGWRVGNFCPDVVVRQGLGQAGEIEVETRAILEAEGVHTEEFSQEVLNCLPPTPWSISPEEIAKRKDLRDLRLFSIDPSTARDLDDALSIEALGGGLWRVGVHIADVAHFIPPGSALDEAAAERATSVYMVQQVYHMLPRLLCEQLCSLHFGVERLAFSVMWELDEQGMVHSQWTGKTVIRSCAQLAYEHAQDMIDGKFRSGAGEEPPAKLAEPHQWSEVVEDVLSLDKIARNMKRRRFEDGALRLDTVKVAFALDDDGNPDTCRIYEQAESNELVAEFMLLANMSVAQMIGMGYEGDTILRRHPRPQDRQLGELEATAAKLGYDIDCSSATTIHQSMRRLREEGEDRVYLDILQLQVVRPMQHAQYFSTHAQPDRDEWRHYALAVPMYTHFTSPIRRYPDILVHRALAHLLASDPTAYARRFSPDPLGDMAAKEGKERREAVAAAAVLAEVAANGEEVPQGIAHRHEAGPSAAGDTARQDQEDFDSSDSSQVGLRDAASSDGDTLISKPPAAASASPQEADGAQQRGKGKPATRIYAEMNTPQKREKKGKNRGRKGGRATEELVEGGTIPVVQDDSSTLSRVAVHCNERKHSAKLCSDASSALYLCVLLRRQPRVVQAVVTIVNGSRFFWVYVPSLGLEVQITTATIVPAVVTAWDLDNRVLTLLPDPKKPAVNCLSEVQNAANLHNPSSLRPMPLSKEQPLQLKAFSKVVVVVSAKSSGPGKPLAAFGVLFTKRQEGDSQGEAGEEGVVGVLAQEGAAHEIVNKEMVDAQRVPADAD